MTLKILFFELQQNNYNCHYLFDIIYFITISPTDQKRCITFLGFYKKTKTFQ